MKAKLFPVLKIGVAVPLLSGCAGAGSVDSKPEYTISGTVMVPDSLHALLQKNTLLASMLSFVFPEVKAMITGNVPLTNATVELLSYHDNGYEMITYEPDITTATDGRGQFRLTTTKPLDSNLVLRVSGRNGVWMHALVTGEYTDINVVSDYVASLVMESVRSNADVFLPYFTGEEIENLQSSIEMLEVDLSGVSSLSEALSLIYQADAGALAGQVALVSTPNLEGSWFYVKKSGPNSCGSPAGVELIHTKLDVSQVNDALTIYLDGSVFSTGTLFGRSIVGLRLESYAENSGTVVQTSSTMTVSSDGKSVDGTITWDWFGGNSSCSGTDVVSVTRTAPN